MQVNETKENLLSRIRTDFECHNPDDVWEEYLEGYYVDRIDEALKSGEIHQYHQTIICIDHSRGYPAIFYAYIENPGIHHLLFILKLLQQYKEMTVIPLGRYLFGLQFMMKRNSILRYYHQMNTKVNVKLAGGVLDKIVDYLDGRCS